jgi:hypothetical protein
MLATFGGLLLPTAVGKELQGLLAFRNYPKAVSTSDTKSDGFVCE